MRKNNLAKMAELMAERGFHIFPLNGKRPATPHGFKDARPSASPWKGFRRYGIGVACGASNIMVLDFDVHSDRYSQEAADALESLTSEYPTVSVRTGGGGVHLVYSQRGLDPEQRFNNKADWLPDGVDVRGDGGYIAWPPSPHPSGTEYRFIRGRSPWEIDFAVVPEFLIAKRNVLKQERAVRSALGEAGGDRLGDWFDANFRVTDILERNGYTPAGRGRWSRPGKRESAGIVILDDVVAFNHSDSDANLEAQVAYTAFHLLAILEFDGDWKAAARHVAGLKAEKYNTWRRRL